MTTDERNGKPSASGFSRLALCPGSWKLEQTLSPQEENKYMALGTAVHAVLAGQAEFDTLTEEGQDIATRCLSQFSEMIGQLDLGERTKEVIEERFWYDDLFSGAIDRIDFFGDTAVVTDYKTGRVAQSGAAENYQLRAYAVLVKKAYPELKTILVAIIQPLAAGKTIAEYNEEDLARAEEEIIGIVRASQKHDAIRTPSPDACKWCRAKSICPEVRGTHKELEVVSNSVVPRLSNEEILAIDDKAEVVLDFIEEVRKEMKARMMAGQQFAGRSLTEGRKVRSVSDTQSVISALSGIVEQSDVLACTKVSVTALEKAYAKAKGLKGKEAKEKFEDSLGWLIETTTGEPSIKRN
jgi:CRISPR/Cas system-associated exonuclease Cas4 (RecB family)